jgi:hypothetical protein
MLRDDMDDSPLSLIATVIAYVLVLGVLLALLLGIALL